VPGAEVPAGAFVTLHLRGALRGCIGQVETRGAVGDVVCAMAASAAVDDPRFPPVSPEELDELEIEVAVLSPPRETAAAAIVPGRHGVIVRRGARQAVFLPQVAPEQGWDREQLLAMLCRKAGLPPDAWREETTVLSVFETQRIAADTA